MISLKSRIAQGGKVYWTTLTIADEQMAILAKAAGYDFVVIDALNGVFSCMENTAKLVRTCNQIGLPCIYRSNRDDDLVRALDLGANGVACMNVRTRQDMEEMVRRVYFHPKGDRRPNPFTSMGHFGIGNFSQIKTRCNDETVLFVFVEENVNTFETMEDIMSVPGVDIAYLGHFVSLRYPETIERARQFTQLADRNRVAVAGFYYGTDDLKYREADALKFELQRPTVVGVSVDCYLAYKGLLGGYQEATRFSERFRTSDVKPDLNDEVVPR